MFANLLRLSSRRNTSLAPASLLTHHSLLTKNLLQDDQTLLFSYLPLLLLYFAYRMLDRSLRTASLCLLMQVVR